MPPISLEDKVALLSGLDFWQTRPLPAHQLPSLFLSDGPHGLRKAARGGSVGLTDSLPATCFPTAAGLAATWDPKLVEGVGRAIGREARALGVHVVLGPGMNIKRHPCGGRNFEYLSEDPLLSGRLAAAMVRGIQSTGVGACLKHFVANNQEDHRLVVDTLVDERSLREIYLRGFEIAVREAAPYTVMSSYNKLNGAYTGESSWLVQGVLRDEWGFDGLVMSDWGAVDDRVAGVAAGLDLEMPGSAGRQDALVLEALRQGRLSEAALDACVQRLLDLQARVIHDEPALAVDLDAHHALARRAAARCCVLLKNQGETLPLRDPARVAVIGAMAQQPRYQGAGSSGVKPTKLTSAWEALSQAVGRDRLRYAAGVDPVDALETARGAEVVLVFAGLPSSYESEGYDRDHVDLPPQQNALIEQLAKECERVVVVLSNGSPVAMPWLDDVDAVVEAYLGGQASGGGVVDVLTGRVNPSGKLAESFAPRAEEHASHAFFPGDGQHVSYREGLYVGYRYLDSVEAPLLFPFGHGLSYTRFDYRDLRCQVEGQRVSLRFTLENTGTVPGAEVVQLYVHDVESTAYRPVHELRAFERVELQPGQHTEVVLELDRSAWAFWDVRRHGWAVEGGAFELRVGSSSRDIRLREILEIAGDDGPFEALAPRCYHGPSHPLRPDDADFVALLGRGLPAKRPVRPFHRNTTVGQLRATLLGRVLHAVSSRVTVRTMGVAGDANLRRMVERALLEMPVRAMVTQAHATTWRRLHALLAFLDWRWLDAARSLLGKAEPRLPD